MPPLADKSAVAAINRALLVCQASFGRWGTWHPQGVPLHFPVKSSLTEYYGCTVLVHDTLGISLQCIIGSLRLVIASLGLLSA